MKEPFHIKDVIMTLRIRPEMVQYCRFLQPYVMQLLDHRIGSSYMDTSANAVQRIQRKYFPKFSGLVMVIIPFPFESNEI